MDLTTLMTQFGIGGVTIFVAFRMVERLYTDMRKDSDRLIMALEKQGDLMEDIVNTLKTIDTRICNLENKEA